MLPRTEPAPMVQPAAGPAFTPRPERFEFTGSGSEYFRIWIVNLLLTIVTIGIYSAWAKVRRTKYFYNNTLVAGSSFEYHGNPISILKGRVIAFGLFILYNVLLHWSPELAIVALIGMAAILPWLLWKSLQFRAWNSSWRGVRFGFGSSAGQAYKTFLLWPILAVVTLYLMLPFAHHQIKKWQHNNARFGATGFKFSNCATEFYKAYLVPFVVLIIGGIVTAVVFGAIFAGAKRGEPAGAAMAFLPILLILGFYLAFMAIGPIMQAMLFNTTWNHTALGDHTFEARVPLGRAAFVGVTNLLGIVCTLGLFIPFAAVRWARLRAEHLTLLPDGSLDDFVADTQSQANATGEGMADLMDFDIGL
jgi:uncharacterized membrane protein YjgN (DUF898 family)